MNLLLIGKSPSFMASIPYRFDDEENRFLAKQNMKTYDNDDEMKKTDSY